MVSYELSRDGKVHGGVVAMVPIRGEMQVSLTWGQNSDPENKQNQMLLKFLEISTGKSQVWVASSLLFQGRA